MKFFNKIAAMLGFTLSLLIGGVASAALPVNGDCAPELSSVRDQFVAKVEALAAASTAVAAKTSAPAGIMEIRMLDGRVPCSLGIGYLDTAQTLPIYSEVHLFEWASVSKPAAKAVMYKLDTAGVRRLSNKAFCPTPGNCPFPLSAPPLDPRLYDITIQHLMDHKAGFPHDGGTYDWTILDFGAAATSYGKKVAQMTRLEWVQWVAKTKVLVAAPGTAFNYSNASSMMLAEVVAGATGKDLAAAVIAYLPDTGLQSYMLEGRKSVPVWGQPRMVQGYVCTNLPECPNYGWEIWQGAIGILSTAEGALRFFGKYDSEGKPRSSSSGGPNGLWNGASAQVCMFDGGTAVFYTTGSAVLGGEFCPLVTPSVVFKPNFGTLDLRQAPRVVEFKYPALNYYFNTASDLEKAILLDARGTFNTTGESWRAYSPGYGGGTADIKRGFFPNIPSHFYSYKPEDWAVLQSLTQKPANDPSFLQIETATLAGYPAINEVCPAGTRPVYRSFRSGSSGVTANHRFMVKRTLYDSGVAEGYAPEEISYCTRE
jgi:CubicO group peptidase (beta-lactamase class C family)